ncbi:MAG: zinc finger domain-containing protein [Candidatus Micrarchaeota archaeon]
MKTCVSCGREVIAGVEFPCPSCGKKLTRCASCRENRNKYVCLECKFTGP